MQFKVTDKEKWKVFYDDTLKDANNNPLYRSITPIPFTGESEESIVNITDEVVESFKDESGDIRFYHVFMWCLPRFQVDGETQTYFHSLQRVGETT